MTQVRIEAHGCDYLIEVDADGILGRRIVPSGKPYEAPLLEHIWGMKLSGIAVDVGAHIGNHSLYLAAVCGLQVVAFEPSTVERLRANVELNDLGGQVRLEPFALGADLGWATEVGKGRLEVGAGEVPVRRLDDYALVGVSLIKIDVEDMEPSVLRGGEETIRRERPVIFAEARDDECHAAIAEVLEPWGYAMTHRFHSRGVATPVERWDG